MALVIPSISLVATSPTSNSMVSTNMTSASIAYFVTGVFAGQSASGASAAQPSAAVLAAQKAVAFTMPGKTFGIFPTGGILTWAWTVLFVATLGFGTVGRIMARKQNKSGKVKQNKAAARTAKEKKTKKGKSDTVQGAPKVEMVDIDISYHKTFGDRPNYYVERLPSTKRPANF